MLSSPSKKRTFDAIESSEKLLQSSPVSQMVTSTTFKPLDWKDRPAEVNEKIDDAFEQIS